MDMLRAAAAGHRQAPARAVFSYFPFQGAAAVHLGKAPPEQ
jgi:hypothetical protein